MTMSEIAAWLSRAYGVPVLNEASAEISRQVATEILIIEDEPLIAMEIVRACESAGACVLKTNTLHQALVLVEEAGLSAAVLDHGLSDGDSSKLCERLKELSIPFVLHSGYSAVEGACRDAVFVAKPENPDVLVTTVEGLLRKHPISQ